MRGETPPDRGSRGPRPLGGPWCDSPIGGRMLPGGVKIPERAAWASLTPFRSLRRSLGRRSIDVSRRDIDETAGAAPCRRRLRSSVGRVGAPRGVEPPSRLFSLGDLGIPCLCACCRRCYNRAPQVYRATTHHVTAWSRCVVAQPGASEHLVNGHQVSPDDSISNLHTVLLTEALR